MSAGVWATILQLLCGVLCFPATLLALRSRLFARRSLGDFLSAGALFQRILALEPENKDAMALYADCVRARSAARLLDRGGAQYGVRIFQGVWGGVLRSMRTPCARS